MSRGSLVAPAVRAWVRSIGEPIALALGRLGLTPNALTVIGFLIALVAAGAAATGSWLAAGLLVVFGAVFDLFDGSLARATGRTSAAGAFLDATFDRAGEGVVFIGIVGGALALELDRTVVLASAAMASAFLVSYTRARAESLGLATGTGMANVGLAPREVRVLILTAGLLAAGLVADPAPALDGALGLIAVLAAITTIQRVVHSVRGTTRVVPSRDER